MKPLLLPLASALLLVPGLLQAQYNLDWYSLGGGGGQATGGVWTVSGALSDVAGTASGGAFALSGGYWSLLGVVPASGGPPMNLVRFGSGARLSWPRSADAFVLEETPTLTGSPAVPWAPSNLTVQTNTTDISVTIPLPVGTRFFRLRKP